MVCYTDVSLGPCQHTGCSNIGGYNFVRNGYITGYLCSRHKPAYVKVFMTTRGGAHVGDTYGGSGTALCRSVPFKALSLSLNTVQVSDLDDVSRLCRRCCRMLKRRRASKKS